ncbi:hypothetical protein ACFOPX_05795 [Helicobacter baculiformis]|uniref:DUF721 domain-containing protein n=1 Tax=Helicobacter baculiformis TaxID=427351 RepID=A0ABV7ZHJ9_9HELI|nr:hypothetical protein [Helicobacter baculiformis]
MKNSQDILSSVLQNKAFLKPLDTRLKLSQLKLFLPLSIRGAVSSIIIKNSKLLLAFNHPSAHNYFCMHAQEFSQILLREVKRLELEIPEDLVVKAYLPSIVMAKFKPKSPKLYYHECAQGTFTNHAQDPQLRAVFERIRLCIQKHAK